MIDYEIARVIIDNHAEIRALENENRHLKAALRKALPIAMAHGRCISGGWQVTLQLEKYEPLIARQKHVRRPKGEDEEIDA